MQPRSDMVVELLDFMGGDLSVVNSARQSFNQESAELGDAEQGLILFLMKNRHGTPFETSVFTFRVEVPIFVAREWFRHRIGSFNEMSGRYTKLLPEFYVPEPIDVRTQVGKPGSYSFEPVRPEVAGTTIGMLSESYRRQWVVYTRLLELGVAKELARCPLGVGIYTRFCWTVNARSFMNFLELRLAPNAMLEIRRAANIALGMYHDKMPFTAEAFETNGRVAP